MSNIEVRYSACRELLCRTVYFKKDRAQRFYPSTFDVGRSMFDVQSFHCYGLLKVPPLAASLQASQPSSLKRCIMSATVP